MNKQNEELAKAYGCHLRYPSPYQVQIYTEEADGVVFNWYPSTGTLGSQKNVEFGYPKWTKHKPLDDFEEVLIYITSWN